MVFGVVFLCLKGNTIIYRRNRGGLCLVTDSFSDFIAFLIGDTCAIYA
jgi:hypothetical protein